MWPRGQFQLECVRGMRPESGVDIIPDVEPGLLRLNARLDPPNCVIPEAPLITARGVAVDDTAAQRVGVIGAADVSGHSRSLVAGYSAVEPSADASLCSVSSLGD